jgi:hypothetical protein
VVSRSLGDSHNFGCRVTRRAGRIEKPRTVLWEWLLLSAKSPLRRALVRAAELDGLGGDAFAFLPDLAFTRTRRPESGSVEAISLRPLGRLSPADGSELAVAVGRSLALFSWLGVSDLHWENLVLGRDARGGIVFAPLDIEMILSDFSLPTHTKLLPDADPEVAAICRHAAGVRRVLPFLGKPVAVTHLLTMASAYHRLLACLDRHARSLARAFASLADVRRAPIRVCLRGTGEYLRPGSEPLFPPLLAAESEQLERGDIPYFFRLYGKTGIRYFASRDLTRTKSIPGRGDVPRLDPILRLSRNFASQNRQRLREQGFFVLLAAFDHASYLGRHEVPGMVVHFGAREFVVRHESGDEWRAPRRLHAVVSSVYQSCRCGEVKSVFVPRVTRCVGAAGERAPGSTSRRARAARGFEKPARGSSRSRDPRRTG